MANVTYENYLIYKKKISNIDAKLARVWEKTEFRSDNNYSNIQEYKELLDMGEQIIPYLVHRMASKGASWIIFSLLHELARVDPIDDLHHGNFYLTTSDWLIWYVNSKYYRYCDTYFGLID